MDAPETSVLSTPITLPNAPVLKMGLNTALTVPICFMVLMSLIFSDQEMADLGPLGQAYMFQERNHLGDSQSSAGRKEMMLVVDEEMDTDNVEDDSPDKEVHHVSVQYNMTT